MHAIDLLPRCAREREVLPASPTMAVRCRRGLARGEQDQLELAFAVPRDPVVRVVPGEPEAIQDPVELRDGTRKVVDGDAEVVEDCIRSFWWTSATPRERRFDSSLRSSLNDRKLLPVVERAQRVETPRTPTRSLSERSESKRLPSPAQSCGGRRSRLTSVRCFFAFRRRSLAPRPGFVGRRGGEGGCSASATRRPADRAPHLCCAIARDARMPRSSAPRRQGDRSTAEEPLPLERREHGRARGIPDQLGSGVGGVHSLPAGAGRPREPPGKLGLGDRESRVDPKTGTVGGGHDSISSSSAGSPLRCAPEKGSGDGVHRSRDGGHCRLRAGHHRHVRRRRPR